MATWACANKLTRSAVQDLLVLLRGEGHDSLPKDCRTLLKTPRSIQVTVKCGGSYSYFGLESCLLLLLETNASWARDNNSIDLIVNIDGIPLFKSNNSQFWPILC
uniref:Uncharacterized protein n=1 Tax=Capitella teleta TaxID=283909 RepID=X2B2T0_CAPTE